MKFAILVALFACLVSGSPLSGTVDELKDPIILNSPQVTNWGSWRDWEYCPEGKYVIGMQLKTHSYQGAFSDDTALNAIRFYCDEIGSKTSDISIESAQGDYGSFGNNYYCEGIATAFQLRSEKSQSIFADDTAANNVRLYCNGQEEYIEGDGERFGDWTHKQQCSKKQAICGIQTQIEGKGSGDDTSLNNFRVRCCDVQDPAEVCVPTDHWELVIECDNTEAVTPTTCFYQRKVGVSHSTTDSSGGYQKSEVYQNIGFGLGGALYGLNLNFRYNLSMSSETGYDWSTSNTEVWSAETTTSVSFEVPPGITTQLLQTVGTCDFYNAKATRVKRIDTEGEGSSLRQTVTYFDF